MEKRTIVFAPTYRSAQFYLRNFGIRHGEARPPVLSSIRGVDPNRYDVIVVNADISLGGKSAFTEEFLDSVRTLELAMGLEVTWFGFGELYE